MNIKYVFILACIVLNIWADNPPLEKHIVIVTASYNNAAWYQRNLDSVFEQKYDNWNLIYVDDCSPDRTADLVYSYIIQKGFEHKVALVCNETRCGGLENQYMAIKHLCKPTDIVVILDGDDWLTGPHVLAHINNLYADGNTWLTHGQFKTFPEGWLGWCEAYSPEVIANNGFRSEKWYLSHLRTFYAGLFHKIKLADLMYEGKFYPMASDLVIMFPMAEMARDHITFCPEILLEYNMASELNEHKVSRQLQIDCAMAARSLPRYEKVESPF